MSQPRKAYGWEKVGRALLEAGSHTLTTDQLEKNSGVKQPARRVQNLRDRGIEIETVSIDAAAGIYGYKLGPDEAPALRQLLAGKPVSKPEPEPEAFNETLFGAPPRRTNHYEQDAA